MSRRYRTNTSYRKNVLLILTLLLSGDIHPHTGPPSRQNVYPCGLCQVPVTRTCHCVCCDNCDNWYHNSCTEQDSDAFAELNKTNVSWLCCKCESVNVSSFSFHSYEFIKHNRFEPLSLIDDPFEKPVLSHTFSPRFISSPTNKSFNCPDIKWETNITQDNCPDRNMQNALIDLNNENDLSQIHDVPTRDKNILDLIFTSNTTLCKSSSRHL